MFHLAQAHPHRPGRRHLEPLDVIRTLRNVVMFSRGLRGLEAVSRWRAALGLHLWLVAQAHGLSAARCVSVVHVPGVAALQQRSVAHRQQDLGADKTLILSSEKAASTSTRATP